MISTWAYHRAEKPPQNICDCIHGYHLPSNKENALLHYCIVPHVRARNEMRAADKNHPSTVVSSDVTRFCQNKKHNLTRLPLVAGSAFAISESLRMFLNQKKDSIFRVIPPDLVCVCVFFIRPTLTFTHFFDPVSVLCLRSTIL